MKHLLSPSQSATLIAKGISADKASEKTPDIGKTKSMSISYWPKEVTRYDEE